MSFLSKILYCWHFIRKNYHQELLESCRDYKLKEKLRKKIEYHKKKIDQLRTVKASY
ncbi:MAG: hypothetical protein ACQEWV_09630 [Bacillota bacterium]